MPELTNDERTVLMIADQGESMMPLGRWEQPVEHLVELGYLERHDKFNNTITLAGKKALGEANEAVDNDAAKALIGRHNAQVEFRQQAEALARQLAMLAKSAVAATGDSPLTALNRCVAVVRDRAAELLTPPSIEARNDQRG